VLAQTAATHNVIVGATGLEFNPSQVVAAIGDTVSFEFHPKNHTLTQSSFANPCVAMTGGVNSGFMPVAANATTFPVFSFKVNQVTPLWFYCAQTGHCQSGMVFALNINNSSANTFPAFLANAMGNGTSASASASSGAAVTASGTAGSGATVTSATVTDAASSASASSTAGTKSNGAGGIAIGGYASIFLPGLGVIAGLFL